jgi:uncharacterized protein (UPF0332 family)
VTDRDTLFSYRLSQADSTLKDARIMLENGGSPRSIVNRAYYAVFYSVLALFLKSNISIKTSKHAGVIAAFDKHFIIPGKIEKLHSQVFHTLFEDRQEFDYKECSSVSDADAREAIKSAENFISKIKAYLES